MATPERQQAPAFFSHYFPFEKTFKDALKLAARFREAEGFRRYVQRRAAFVVPAVALFVLVSVACAAALVILLAERHSMLALPGMLLAPLVLAGSFFVMVFVFFSWLEGRALSQALGRRPKKPLDFGKLPDVPWVLAGFFLALPILNLAVVAPVAALVLILLAVLIILTIARFDR